jgi:uncharacterized protein YdiU (UPF0061 family)
MTTLQETVKTGWNLDCSYCRLPVVFYSRLGPTPVRAPEPVIINDALAGALGLDIARLRSRDGVAELAGNALPEGAEPIAQAYSGHQFGYFTMLGDGRALLLGEQLTPSGDRYDIQLKGSGRTTYSRGGDGRAALGPMLREYIVSEAMHGLGIPTTRSLAVVTTGEKVRRGRELPGAVLTRVASSHIRVGTFQYAAKWCSRDDLRALADYTLARHFPGCAAEENRYLRLLRGVAEKQARLIAKWQLAGFIHGVMNTDNMAVGGETIDYGPCAFMDAYHPGTVFSSIDLNGRYAYGKQPEIGGWNLARFAETLLPLIHEDREKAIALAREEIENYKKMFHENWLSGMREKLGLMNSEDGDEALASELLDIMAGCGADFTNTFLELTYDKAGENGLHASPDFACWHVRWKERLRRQTVSEKTAADLMRRSNPAVIPRNHRVEEALAAAERGDYSVMQRLLDVLKKPYAHTKEQAGYASPPGPSEHPYKTFCGT